VSEAPLLDVRELRVAFAGRDGEVAAVRGVSLRLEAGRTLALVGESGCGKSVTALALLRLLEGNARISAAALRFRGQELLELDEEGIRQIRGGKIGMVFQEPMTSLNPVFRVGSQIAEVLELHRGLDARAARRAAVELLGRVRMSDAARRAEQYPHELSGGMKQRVMIAMALACDPALLIADEATTALDVTIQAQILALLETLQRESGMAILLITHDLGIVAQHAQRVAVMYAGEIVEEAPVGELFRQPLHPYTRALLRALPRRGRRGRLEAIEGTVPSPRQLPPGCVFSTRCGERLPHCAEQAPPLVEVGGRPVRCWLHAESSP
jgi:peptide/nickel transport system ATP-binding protein